MSSRYKIRQGAGTLELHTIAYSKNPLTTQGWGRRHLLDTKHAKGLSQKSLSCSCIRLIPSHHKVGGRLHPFKKNKKNQGSQSARAQGTVKTNIHSKTFKELYTLKRQSYKHGILPTHQTMLRPLRGEDKNCIDSFPDPVSFLEWARLWDPSD